MFFLVFLAAQPAPIAHNLLFFDRHQIVTARRTNGHAKKVERFSAVVRALSRRRVDCARFAFCNRRTFERIHTSSRGDPRRLPTRKTASVNHPHDTTTTPPMAAAGYDNLQLRGKYGTEKYWPEKKLKICVTGAGGFIASHLAKRLKEEGHHIVGCDWKRNEHMPVRHRRRRRLETSSRERPSRRPSSRDLPRAHPRSAASMPFIRNRTRRRRRVPPLPSSPRSIDRRRRRRRRRTLAARVRRTLAPRAFERSTSARRRATRVD